LDYSINYNYQSQQEIVDSLNALRQNFGLSNFVLWSAEGTLLVVEMAAGPEAKGRVLVNIELLDQDFIDSFAKGCWILSEREQAMRRRFLIGKGSVSSTFHSKKELMEAIKPFGTSEISKLLRKATV